MLEKRGVKHNVLNAKQHEREAGIIAEAGQPAAVTIATNMAGRGTDIVLGTGVTDVGGLHIIGTERHESRRIDNQLRGRSGRQGDPGHSKFFLSLEDDLMRIFGTDKLDSMLQRLGLKENEAIVHSWINKALEKAQQKVEARNFDIRKNLLKFDNVMNDQRKVIFDQRIEWMRDDAVNEIVADMRHAAIEDLVARHLADATLPEQWDVGGLDREVRSLLTLAEPLEDWAREDGMTVRELRARLTRAADRWIAAKDEKFGAAGMRHMQRLILLHALDTLWREHLLTLDDLRRAVGLRRYARRQPLVRCAGGFVIDVAASPAPPRFIRLVTHLGSRSCMLRGPLARSLEGRFSEHQSVGTTSRSLHHRSAAAMLPPSTVVTSAVVFSASAWARKACATSSAATSRPSRLPRM